MQPSGWPSATAPPFTFTRAGSRPGDLDHRQRLRRESFVQLDHVNLIELQTRDLERFRNRVHRADAHLFRRSSGRSIGDETRQRLQAQLARAFGAHHHGRRRAIAHLRAVPCRHHAARVKRRLQSSQRLDGSIRARAFVGIERDVHRFRFRAVRGAVRARFKNRVADGHRHDLVLEFARRDRRQRFLVAREREFVGLLPRDAVFLREIFGRQAHVDVGVRKIVHQPRIRRDFVAAHGNHAHGFGAAGDGNVALPGHDSLGGDGDGLQARRTKPVDGHRRDADGQSRAQRGNPRDIHSLLRLGRRAADDHVFDIFGVDALGARQRFLDHQRSQIVRPRRAQRALRRLPHGGPHRTDQDGFSHESPQTKRGLPRRKLLHWMPAGKKKQPREDVERCGDIAPAGMGNVEGQGA